MYHENEAAEILGCVVNSHMISTEVKEGKIELNIFRWMWNASMQ